MRDGVTNRRPDIVFGSFPWGRSGLPAQASACLHHVPMPLPGVAEDPPARSALRGGQKELLGLAGIERQGVPTLNRA